MLRIAVGKPKQFPDTPEARAQRCGRRTSLRRTNSGAGGFRYGLEVREECRRAIELKVLNYNSKDELDYSDPPKRYVVVGGNRLSRGLTLEGLSISFFTRDTNYYDTLLQMGRWFGYRPGYVDLTRIYVEGAMARQFSDLARVELELRADIAKYARKPDPPTPLELMPRIRSHPSLGGDVATEDGRWQAGQHLLPEHGPADGHVPDWRQGCPASATRRPPRSLIKGMGRPDISLSS